MAAGAFAALGALAACSSSVANTAGHVPSAVAKPGTAAVGPSVQALGVPSIISQAIASGRAVAPTRKAAHKPATTQPKAKSSASPSTAAQPSATQPSSTGTSTGTSTGGQSGGDPSGENPSTALSGFTLKYVQEFTGDSVPVGWDTYTGVPGGESSKVAQWVPSMCTFSGGEAHFMASGVDSCGMQY